MKKVTGNSGNGKNVGEQFRPYKLLNQQMAVTVEKTSLENRGKIVLDLRVCGNRVVTAKVDGVEKVLSAIFCKRRLCPMCAWRRSLRVFGNIYAIIGSPVFEGLRYLFLTLTIRNCDAASLPGTLDLLESAWRQLTKDKRQPFCRSFLGTFRSVEITYNAVEHTYHPHIHVIAAVQESYFSKENSGYVNHERLMKLWRRVLGVDYDPQVYIEAVERNDPAGAVAEVAKYTVKPVDYVDRPEVVEVLEPALKGRRLIAYGGLFKVVKRRLKLEDEAGEGVNQAEVDAMIRDPLIEKLVYRWNCGMKVYNVEIFR